MQTLESIEPLAYEAWKAESAYYRVHLARHPQIVGVWCSRDRPKRYCKTLEEFMTVPVRQRCGKCRGAYKQSQRLHVSVQKPRS